jgi:DNA-binding transcriptional MerR regulator
MTVVSLLRIGDLARLGGVSVRMLRHYHEIGLLVPAHIDEPTGFRSYGAEQLSALRRIVGLKELGLSLAEVESVVNGDLDLDGLRTLLSARRREAIEQARSGTRPHRTHRRLPGRPRARRLDHADCGATARRGGQGGRGKARGSTDWRRRVVGADRHRSGHPAAVSRAAVTHDRSWSGDHRAIDSVVGVPLRRLAPTDK